jgi:hypothetical protein
VFNDVGPKQKLAEKARLLSTSGLPIAETDIVHRASHIFGLNVGKSSAEANNGKDKLAAEAIEGLCRLVKEGCSRRAPS